MKRMKLRIGSGSKKAIAIDFYLMILLGMQISTSHIPQRFNSWPSSEPASFLPTGLFRRVKEYHVLASF